MNTATHPKNIAEYLDLLRSELSNADPALVQDALYDAEDYLRSELAANPNVREEDLLASIVQSYGAPSEVADIYREQESTVAKAMHMPRASKKPKAERGAFSKFFGVALEAKTYGALAYLLLSLPLGIFYFAWATTGISLSFGLLFLIIGIPFIVFFMGTVWALSLMEGRLVETLLGERMPRRPMYSTQSGFWNKVKEILSDARTYSTLMYMLLTLPIGIIYFTIIVALLTLSFGLIAGGVGVLFDFAHIYSDNGLIFSGERWLAPIITIAGILLLFVTMHLARGLGYVHAQFAKNLLVKAGAD
jgi:uncharacterized membrane protein